MAACGGLCPGWRVAIWFTDAGQWHATGFTGTVACVLFQLQPLRLAFHCHGKAEFDVQNATIDLEISKFRTLFKILWTEQVESDLIWFCCFLPSTASREKSAAVGGGRFLNPFTESANVSLTEICYKDYLAPLARKLLVNFKVICPSLCDVLIDVIKNATLDLRDPAMGGP